MEQAFLKESIMGKDPAVLFYTGDFLSGTMTLTDSEIGQYIKLLCIQHQSGPMTYDFMCRTLLSADNPVWSKFSKTEEGLFFNERMMIETEKRSKYCESRQKGAYAMHMHKHMQVHMGNRNRNEIKDVILSEKKEVQEKGKLFVPPEIGEIREYCFERRNQVDPETFFNFYESKGWMVGKNKMKDWRASIRTWEKNKIEKRNNFFKKEVPLSEIIAQAERVKLS